MGRAQWAALALLCIRAERILEVRIDGEARSGAVDGGDVWRAAADTIGANGLALAPGSPACRDAEAPRESSCLAALLVELLAPPAEAAPGCPGDFRGAAVRALVAVPSAATNARRRAAIRGSWCRRAAATHGLSGGRASVAVRFFVGAPPLEAEDALRAENATAGDVVRAPGLVDAATNVSAKLLYSLRYFAASPATHFVRVEDDVYLFPDRLCFSLLYEPRGDRGVLGAFSANATVLRGLTYPRGFAVVLPRRVAAALAVLDDTVGFGIRSAADGGSGRPAGAKGGWVRDAFWCDDQYLGLLLHPLAVDFLDEPRFHDLPSRGPHAARLGHGSLAVNGVQTDAEFERIHSGEALGGAPVGLAPASWSRVDDLLAVEADVDGAAVRFTLADPVRETAAACEASAARAAGAACAQPALRLPAGECAAIAAALRSVCDAAAPRAPRDWTLGFRPAYAPDATLPLLDLVTR